MGRSMPPKRDDSNDDFQFDHWLTSNVMTRSSVRQMLGSQSQAIFVALASTGGATIERPISDLRSSFAAVVTTALLSRSEIGPRTKPIRRESADFAVIFVLNTPVAMYLPSLLIRPRATQMRNLYGTLLLTNAAFSRMSASG